MRSALIISYGAIALSSFDGIASHAEKVFSSQDKSLHYQLMVGPAIPIERPYTTLTTVQTFILKGEVYSIPGQYFLSHWSEHSLVVAFPGFKPFSIETKSCLTAETFPNPSQECFRVEFNISSIRFKEQSSAEDFEATRRVFSSPFPEAGPNGLKEYHVGPVAEQMDYYRGIKKGEIIALVCIPHEEITWPQGDCVDSFDYAPGVRILFRIPESRLKYAGDVQVGLRRLVDTFRRGDSRVISGSASLQERSDADSPPRYQ